MLNMILIKKNMNEFSLRIKQRKRANSFYRKLPACILTSQRSIHQSKWSSCNMIQLIVNKLFEVKVKGIVRNNI